MSLSINYNKEVEEDLDELLEKQRRPYQYYEQQLVRRIHHFYISEEIGEPAQYVEMIHRLMMAGPEEMVFIHLNCPGGRTDTGIQIVNAIQMSQAHVVCIVESEAHSMATLIFLAADEFVVHDNCLMMFHNFSGGVYGKGHEQMSHVKATTIWFEEMARKLYVPFMSDDEFNSLIRGEDLWLSSEAVRERLTAMVAILEQEQADAALAEEEAANPPAKRPAKKPAKKVAKKAGAKKKR